MTVNDNARIVVCGDSLTFWKKWINVTKSEKCKELSRSEILIRRRNRSRKGFIRTLNRVNGTHQCVISLIFPNNIVGDANKAKCKRILFKKFVDKLRYKYKVFRFIYKMDWDIKPGIHYHMIGSLYKNRCNFDISAETKVVRDLWAKTVGIKDEKLKEIAANIVPYNKLHDSYLTGIDKRDAEMRCADIVGNCNMYGVINKRHFKFYRKRTLMLTRLQFECFCDLIIEYLCSVGKSVKSYARQLERIVGMLSFIPHDKIIEFYRAAKSL